MSTITDSLEAEVAAIRAIMAKAAGREPAPRERSWIDRHFARIMRLIAPRVRHFIRAYGLADMAEDAAQACAIGVHRAIGAYDPSRARFTTFVNWQLRGELQGLRHRVRPRLRGHAGQMGAVTISLDGLQDGPDGMEFADEALERTEALAAETMARRACGRLLDDHQQAVRSMALRRIERGRASRGSESIKPGTIAPRELARVEARLERERAIALAHLFGDMEVVFDDGLSADQRRQIARNTISALSERARGNPRFDPGTLVPARPSPSRH